MSMPERAPHPLARTEGLVVQELEGEVLVYDLERHKAHCLGSLLASVWRACDGTSDVEAIARRVAKATGSPLDAPLAALAVHRLGRARLLQSKAVFLADSGRRALLRSAAAVSGLTLMSIVAPHAAQAATCISRAACETTLNNACTGQPCCEGAGRLCKKQGGGAFCSCF
jgi:hypothetical protein